MTARFILRWLHPHDRRRVTRYVGEFLREGAILIAVFSYLDQLFTGDGALDPALTLETAVLAMVSLVFGIVAGCWSERGES